jgi:hypothetical protein
MMRASVEQHLMCQFSARQIGGNYRLARQNLTITALTAYSMFVSAIATLHLQMAIALASAQWRVGNASQTAQSC